MFPSFFLFLFFFGLSLVYFYIICYISDTSLHYWTIFSLIFGFAVFFFSFLPFFTALLFLFVPIHALFAKLSYITQA